MGQRVGCVPQQFLSLQELSGDFATSLVCDQNWPPTSTRTNAVVRAEDPEFHPNSVNSQNLPKTFPRNLHVKLVTFLALGDNPRCVWAGLALCWAHCS